MNSPRRALSLPAGSHADMDAAIRGALFEDALEALEARQLGAIVELCRAAGPQLLRMQSGAASDTMLHLAPHSVYRG